MSRSTFLLSLFAVLLFPSAVCADPSSPLFRRVTPDAWAHMEKQRAFVAQLIAQHIPSEKIVRGEADFRLLQRIVDAKLIGAGETWKLQALGIVLGDALVATVKDLTWWEVTDEYGTDPTLRYRESTVHFNVLTMISKRIEIGKSVDVVQMAEQVADFSRTKAKEYK